MSGFHYTEFSKTGSILLNAEEKDELFDYIDRLKAENKKLRELVRDLYIDLAAILGDGLWMEPYENEMVELGVDFDG